MSNKIYLVRHGENTANITKEFSYKRIDYSLTQKGIIQAQQTAEFFKNKKIDYIFSSPLKRAKETAEIIANELNIQYTINENFRELNVGELEGKEPNKETWDSFYKVVNDWLSNISETSFPNGENLITLIERFKVGILESIYNIPDKTVLIVGHAGIFTHGIIEIANITNKQEFYDQENGNCSITELEVKINQKELDIKIKKWARTDHLSGEAAKIISGMLK